MAPMWLRRKVTAEYMVARVRRVGGLKEWREGGGVVEGGGEETRGR